MTRSGHALYDAVVISDIHLGSDNCQAKYLVHFLDSIRRRRDCRHAALILNGDVFDSIDFRRLKKHHWKILSLSAEALRRVRDHLDQRQPRRPGGDRLAPARRDLSRRDRRRERRTEGSCSCTATGSTSSSRAIRSSPGRRPDVPTSSSGSTSRTTSPSWRSGRSKTFLRCAEKIEADAVRYAERKGATRSAAGTRTTRREHDGAGPLLQQRVLDREAVPLPDGPDGVVESADATPRSVPEAGLELSCRFPSRHCSDCARELRSFRDDRLGRVDLQPEEDADRVARA